MTDLQEIWKPIKGYEGLYEISNFGRVVSLEREWTPGLGGIRTKPKTQLAPRNWRGYSCVALCKNGKVKQSSIHLLVWDHFGDKARNDYKLQVDHIDENKKNNCINNLQLLTNRQNTGKGKQKYRIYNLPTGVYYRKNINKFRSMIQINGKSIHLGYFNSIDQASNAYKEAMERAA